MCPSLHLTLSPSIHPSIHLSIHPYTCPSIRPPICPSIRPITHSIPPSVGPSTIQTSGWHLYISFRQLTNKTTKRCRAKRCSDQCTTQEAISSRSRSPCSSRISRKDQIHITYWLQWEGASITPWQSGISQCLKLELSAHSCCCCSRILAMISYNLDFDKAWKHSGSREERDPCVLND